MHRHLSSVMRIVRSKMFLSTTVGSAAAAVFLYDKNAEPTKEFPKIKTVIFDFDGTIVDSETKVYFLQNERCMNKFGAKYTMELHHGQMGRQLNEAVKYMLNETGLNKKGILTEEYVKCFRDIPMDVMKQIQPMLGARRLIEHLHTQKIQIAICTSSESYSFAKKQTNCKDLVDKMCIVVTAGDDPEIRGQKPDPDPYLVTMRRLPHKVRPEQVLVIEDSEMGVRSALAAGVNVVWIPEQKFLTEEMQKSCREMQKSNPKLIEVLPSMDHFKPEKYGLPRFPDEEGTWLYFAISRPW